MTGKTLLVIVGVNHWELTESFYNNLRQFNPRLEIVVVDNGSREPYPIGTRIDVTVGYSAAMNFAVKDKTFDWVIFCNNDCVCTGPIDTSELDDGAVYGEAWKYEYSGSDQLPAVVDSGFLYIPRRIWDAVGPFDEKCDAAFEEIDLALRVLNAGFRLDVCPNKSIRHLNLHTRYEVPHYHSKWSATEKYFWDKHKETSSVLAKYKADHLERL